MGEFLQENHYEKEIDIKDLFKIIWDKRIFILIFTFFITIISFVYVSLKTPIYEVKSVVRIGYINDQLLDDGKIIVKKIKLTFNVENKKIIAEDSSIVSKVILSKNLNSFIEIYTQGHSNDKALEKNNEVVKFIQDEYLHKINQHKLKINLDIKNLNEQINIIKNAEVYETKRQINIIKQQVIPKIEKEIKKITLQVIPKIDEEINLIKSQDITNLDNRIKFIKNKELKFIDKKIELYHNKLIEYEKNIKELTKKKSKDNSQNILSNIQLFNIHNLVLNIENNIETLRKDKEKLKFITIKEIEDEKLKLVNINIEDLKIKKDNLLKINIKQLEDNKKNMLTKELYKLNDKLNISIPKKVENLENKIIMKKQNLINIKNTETVGNVLLNNSAKYPKKKLIIFISFVMGLISSIIIVFFIQLTREKK